MNVIAQTSTKPILTGIPETLLIPLWARCNETSQPEPIIQDYIACELLAAIDYNFSQFESAWKTQVGVAIRTYLLDQAVTEFIKKHPQALVINLGAGLDTRFFRVDNMQINWVDIDLPEVISLKRQLISENERYQFIAQSIFDRSWFNTISETRRPTLFIAEGLLMYFNPTEVKLFLNDISSWFSGSEMLLEIISPTVSKMSRWHDSVSKTEATFKWGIKDSGQLGMLCSNLNILNDWNYLDYYPKRWRWIRILTKIQILKHMFSASIVHVKFMKT